MVLPPLQNACADYSRLFADDIVHHLTITITQDEWNGMCQDMLDYSAIDERMRTGNYRRATLTYEDELGVIVLGDVGIRTRGNTSRVIPEDGDGKFHRAHFALRFDETLGLTEGTPEYAERKQRTFCGLEKLNLKWHMWTDDSHIRELFCFDALNKAGVLAPQVSLATLTIDIEGRQVDYGVYMMIEPIDKKFLTKRFGKAANDGNLYKCLWEQYCPATLETGYLEGSVGVKEWESAYRPSYDLKTNKTQADTSDIVAFINNINTLDDESFAVYIEQVFEVDRFLRYLAMNVLLGTPDDYRSMGNNYYLYFNNRGKIDLIPYDYDAALGGGWSGVPVWDFEGIAEADIYEWHDLAGAFLSQATSRPLCDRILSIDAYRQQYEGYLKSFIDEGIFSYDAFAQKFAILESLYGDYACSDTVDTGEMMRLTNENWYFDTKTRSVLDQLTHSSALVEES